MLELERSIISSRSRKTTTTTTKGYHFISYYTYNVIYFFFKYVFSYILFSREERKASVLYSILFLKFYNSILSVLSVCNDIIRFVSFSLLFFSLPDNYISIYDSIYNDIYIYLYYSRYICYRWIDIYIGYHLCRKETE